VVHDGLTTGVHAFGTRSVDSSAATSDSQVCRDDSLFLIASLTKPIVAMATLRLVERGELCLNDRVADIVPGFGGADRKSTTIRHLLTHTSGLPDMLPNNRALRAANAPLERFVEGACGVTLDFPPGRGMQYQSMGFALLGDIIQQVSGVTCAEFLRRELFDPLGMHDSHLGLPDEGASTSRTGADAESLLSRIAEVRLPPEQAEAAGWNWNSPYWRTFGAPWGGMYSTVHDLLTFCRMILRGGTYAGGQVYSPATIAAATSNQLEYFHDLPDADRRTRGWGFGWRFNWPAHNTCFCDLLSESAFGHWGATGTLFWIDPERDAAAVILSTQPLDFGSGPVLTRLSNMIAAAL
jgi:CubicO group peptidase (beta-lactamase class C family)